MLVFPILAPLLRRFVVQQDSDQPFHEQIETCGVLG
ncbi:hypothetical protein L284_02370 [Novosphingobium lindaniclasticum LE124]|uniref:Uncharacterized protein n=1 Tax=Novosphingobium lindaniclasticum LE124 TaxID=1096930 RepID=T0I4F6_9SPHN|nr:hypothetical protein L284_02370 [Novosphingobium lindaniclasticum LE124]